ncbi:MAG: hypothetical protein ABIQ15_03480 [Nocardioides sp.]
MIAPARWSVAAGSGLLLSLTALVPLAAAAEAPVPAVTAVTRASWSTGGGAAGVEPSPARAAVERAIDPTDYQCGRTAFDTYIDGLIASISDEDFAFLIGHLEMLDIPTYDALVFARPGDSFYELTTHAAQLTKTFRDVKRFWDIDAADIQLQAMHGATLLDAAKVTRTLAVYYDVPESLVAGYAKEIADYVNADKAAGGRFYDNPLFTLNAFAFSGEGEAPPFDTIPDKLIFGDGLLAAFDTIGLGDVGPRVVMGHEFGHHIQFEQGLFATDPPLPAPEATRRTELMADAFAAYFGTHKRGLALNAKRVVDALQSFYVVGDCQFDNPGHHGTPNQRLRAAQWGASVAQAAAPRSMILGSLAFAGLFEATLPTLIAPDA